MPLDRDALRQILLNLLDNAVKYGPAGQTITVGSEIAGDAGASHLGRGSRPRHSARTIAQRVWEPYVRLNRDAESATGGSGIGLSVVRELVTLHGGRTRVEAARRAAARASSSSFRLARARRRRRSPTPPAPVRLQLKAVP